MQTVAESASTVQMHHTLFADAVHQVSQVAHAKLPESLHGRLERATAIVLSGGVFVEEDGSTQVRCTNGWYSVNGHCPRPACVAGRPLRRFPFEPYAAFHASEFVHQRIVLFDESVEGERDLAHHPFGCSIDGQTN